MISRYLDKLQEHYITTLDYTVNPGATMRLIDGTRYRITRYRITRSVREPHSSRWAVYGVEIDSIGRPVDRQWLLLTIGLVLITALFAGVQLGIRCFT